MSEPFYITTPIYYVNARPHLGHAYTTIVADVVSRFYSMKDTDTFFLTGTDEHGDKIIRAAKNENISPRQYVDQISNLYRSLWPKLNISYDRFIRTTDPGHIEVVERVLQKIYDRGDIYFSEYEGLYCYGCERFYTERELVDDKCPDHETEPETIKESNYFFKMSKYQDWLIEHIRKHPDFIRPERYKNEVLSFLKEPLEDLCISRPKKRLKWGITLPFDDDYVTYVWFDALLNYVSALGYPEGDLFKKFWPVAQHIVAKDILKPHGIYWPTMLKAAQIPVYQHLNVHGYWNVDQSKMSKSIGNVADPMQLINVYGLDAFRFFLMRDMVFGLDSNFNEESLVHRINADLANDMGNLFSRVITMANKYCKAVVPQVDPEVESEFEFGIRENALQALQAYDENMSCFAFHKALMAVWDFIGFMNKYVDMTAPWELAKKKSAKKHLDAVMYNLLEGLRIVAGLIYPVMPDTADTMVEHLGLGADPETPGNRVFSIEQLKRWKSIPPGTKIHKSTILFPRVDVEKVREGTKASKTSPAQIEDAIMPFKSEITMEDFAKIDLRAATVIHAEAIPKAKRLMKLEVDVGEKRTIVAGIAEDYAPDDIIGKQVIIVANLKPAKLMGIMSNGMLIAGAGNKGFSVATFDRPVSPGTPFK